MKFIVALLGLFVAFQSFAQKTIEDMETVIYKGSDYKGFPKVESVAKDGVLITFPAYVSDSQGRGSQAFLVSIDSSELAEGDPIVCNEKRQRCHQYQKFVTYVKKNGKETTEIAAECLFCKDFFRYSGDIFKEMERRNKTACKIPYEVLVLYRVGFVNISGRRLIRYTYSREKAMQYLKWENANSEK